jgi:hypothetical protein
VLVPEHSATLPALMDIRSTPWRLSCHNLPPTTREQKGKKKKRQSLYLFSVTCEKGDNFLWTFKRKLNGRAIVVKSVLPNGNYGDVWPATSLILIHQATPPFLKRAGRKLRLSRGCTPFSIWSTSNFNRTKISSRSYFSERDQKIVVFAKSKNRKRPGEVGNG